MLTLEDVIPLHVTTWVAPEDHPLRGEVGEMFAFAIRHPAGLILFETGFGRNSKFMDERFRTEHHPIEDELRAIGHATSDVSAIVNSHLHFDHCGSNYLFAGVPIYAQEAEYAAAHQPDYTVQRWVDFPDADYHQIEGDLELAPGIRIISTRGHSPGHQSMLVETNSGLVVLAGQALYCPRDLEHIQDTGRALPEYLTDDEENYVASAQHLIALSPKRLYFSHDRSIYESAG